MLPAGFVAGFRSESALERTVYSVSVCYIFVVLTPRYTKIHQDTPSTLTSCSQHELDLRLQRLQRLQRLICGYSSCSRPRRGTGSVGGWDAANFERRRTARFGSACHILGICGMLRQQGLVPVLSSVAWVPRQGRIGEITWSWQLWISDMHTLLRCFHLLVIYSRIYNIWYIYK